MTFSVPLPLPERLFPPLHKPTWLHRPPWLCRERLTPAWLSAWATHHRERRSWRSMDDVTSYTDYDVLVRSASQGSWA